MAAQSGKPRVVKMNAVVQATSDTVITANFRCISETPAVPRSYRERLGGAGAWGAVSPLLESNIGVLRVITVGNAPSS